VKTPPNLHPTHPTHHLNVVDVFHHLLKGASFHLLPFEVVERLGEVEEDTTLTEFLDEKLFAFIGVRF
jgi:hypothetical protein